MHQGTPNPRTHFESLHAVTTIFCILQRKQAQRDWLLKFAKAEWSLEPRQANSIPSTTTLPQLEKMCSPHKGKFWLALEELVANLQ